MNRFKTAVAVLTAILTCISSGSIISFASGTAYDPCDVNKDGSVTIVDSLPDTQTEEKNSDPASIAAHSSTLYKEYFNDLKYVKTGMEILLYNTDKQCYTYNITQVFVVDPAETWILQDFHDDRVTLVTCTDDGSRRLVVVGIRNK